MRASLRQTPHRVPTMYIVKICPLEEKDGQKSTYYFLGDNEGILTKGWGDSALEALKFRVKDSVCLEVCLVVCSHILSA